MSASPTAQALLNAYRKTASGVLDLAVAGRHARIMLKEGAVVGIDAAFAHQTLGQSLLAAGKLDVTMLDALWARGEAGELPAETLESVGVSLPEASAFQVLGFLRKAAALAAQVTLSPGDAQGAALVHPPWAVRAAFDGSAKPLEGQHARCADAAACSEWVYSDDEYRALQALGDWTVASASNLSWGLLELLAEDGKLELLSEEKLREQERKKREQEEQLLREQEEQKRREQAEQQLREQEAQKKREHEEQQLREQEEARRSAREAEGRRLEAEKR